MFLKLITIHFLLCFSIVTYCQELSLYKNYHNNSSYNINPATAGYKGSFFSELSASKKWFGVNGSPESQVLSNSIRLGEEEFYTDNMLLTRPLFNFAPRIGLGFSIFNEKTGPQGNTGFLLAYAYHLPIQDNRLSFGLAGVLSQYRINTQEFRAISMDDPSLYTNENAFLYNANFGAMYYNTQLFLGVSAIGLLNFTNDFYTNKISPDFLVCGGYKFKLSNELKFEPSAYIWALSNVNPSVDINTKFYLREQNWLLLSYNTLREIKIGIGFSIKQGVILNYIYSTDNADVSNYSFGGHSISIKADVASLIQRHNY